MVTRGDELVISGESNEVEKIAELFNGLLYLYRDGNPVTSADVRYSIRMLMGRTFKADVYGYCVGDGQGKAYPGLKLGQKELSGGYPEKLRYFWNRAGRNGRLILRLLCSFFLEE